MRGPFFIRGAAVLAGALAVLGAPGCSVDVSDNDDGSTGETGIDTQQGRYGHTQTLLADGTVLVVGGLRRTDRGFDLDHPTTAELFDPATEGFRTVASSILLRRAFHAAVYMDAATPDPADDFVLVAGGIDEIDDAFEPFDDALDSVVRIDVGDGSFAVTQVGALPTRLLDLTGHALPDSRAMFIGGRDADGDPRGAVQVWSADLATTTSAQLLVPRFNHRSAFVPNPRAGWIVVTGGRGDDDVIIQREAIDLEDLSVHAVGGGRSLQYHSLSFLDNGTPGDFSDDAVVEAGGLSDVEEDIDRFLEDHLDDVTAFRLADQGLGVAPTATPVGGTAFLPERVFFHDAVAVDGQRVFVTGGFESLFVDEDGFFTGSFIDSDPTDHAAVVTCDGVNLAVTVLPRLVRDRAMHASGLLADGSVLVTGGINDDRNSVRGAEVIPTVAP